MLLSKLSRRMHSAKLTEKLTEIKKLLNLPGMSHLREKWKKLPVQRKFLNSWNKKPWLKWVLLGLLIVCLSAGSAYLLTGITEGPAAANSRQNVYIKVKPGMNADTIGTLLQEHGVIGSKYKFWFIAKLNGYDSQFKTGSYAFRHNMEPREVLQILVSGTTSTIKFTIPEGYTVEEIAKRLSDEGLVDREEFLREAKDFAPYGYIKKDRKAKYYAEGFLFPDTYEISSDGDVQSILKMMTKDFDDRLTTEMRERAKAMHLSVYEVVTLASLVEKEARFAEDRPIIAQVFLKRLKIGMPLQSDTTLQYLLGAPKEDVSIQDTKMDSPYNTYQNMGLPPGPIANPGIDSIKAVLHPADTDYLYFVADRQGHNHYSNTYEEHLRVTDQVR